VNRWSRTAFLGPAERRPLPPSVQQIAINDDALWDDLCDPEQWKPLQDALKNMLGLINSPQSINASSLTVAEWNLVHLAVVFEIERLQYLLLARQLSDRIQELDWEEPLSSLLHGLDVAAASAIETGHRLAVEINAEDTELDDDAYASRYDTEDEADDAGLPDYGRGDAYVLYRRFAADVQCVLDLLGAVCEAAYEDGDRERGR
jgi:hypothetical protein